MKETHEQHKTKIDIDELISGTTNITYCKFGGNPFFTQKGGIGPLFDAS
jgi:hypothetical protein